MYEAFKEKEKSYNHLNKAKSFSEKQRHTTELLSSFALNDLKLMFILSQAIGKFILCVRVVSVNLA